MRVGEILREAARDIRTGAGRAVTFAVAFSVCVGGVAVGAGLGQAQLVDDARAYVASGAATYVMKASGRIDGRACDALAAMANVRAAGALREDERPLLTSALPQTPISAFEVSPGFPGLLDMGGGMRPPGVAVSADVAAVLGTRTGSRLATPRGETAISGVFRYPEDGRDSLLAFAAVAEVPPSDAPFDACWAEIWPEDEVSVASLGRSVLPSSSRDGDPPTLVQLNQTRGTRFAGTNVVDQVTTTVLAALGGAALGALQVFRRRLSLASDRHIGVGLVSQVMSQAVQALVWAFAGIASTIAVATWVFPLALEDRLPLMLAAAITLGVGASSAVSACAAATCLVSERSLFRYFKTR